MHRPFIAAAFVVGCITGCGDAVVVEHGFVGNGDPPGNFPEPALSRCGPLPDDVAPLSDLGAAWAIVALPGAETENGDPVPAGSMWLRLGDHGFEDCGGAFFSSVECSLEEGCDWAMSIGVTDTPVEPSFHDLSRLPESEFLLGVGQSDVGPAIIPGRGGTLILHEVTPACVVGELQDVEGADGVPRSGGFVAETCQRQCIPTEMGWGC